MKAFIPSSLDDYNLTPDQFRIFCHVARRGECYESVGKIAKHCGFGRNKARFILKFLVSRNLISSVRKVGHSVQYAVNDDSEWLEPLPPYSRGSSGPGYSYKIGVPPSPRMGGDPYHPGGAKGYPIKAIPLRRSPPPQKNEETKSAAVTLRTVEPSKPPAQENGEVDMKDSLTEARCAQLKLKPRLTEDENEELKFLEDYLRDKPRLDEAKAAARKGTTVTNPAIANDVKPYLPAEEDEPF